MIYGFLLNMWIMKRINETHLDFQVTRGNITTEEKAMIISTPQV